MMNKGKLEVLEHYLKNQTDYYKPIRTDVGFAGRNDNYIEYTSNADRYENLSPIEYLTVIRPYLRNLIKDHKTIMELNNNNNINTNNNKNNTTTTTTTTTTNNNNNNNNTNTTTNNNNTNANILMLILILILILTVIEHNGKFN